MRVRMRRHQDHRRLTLGVMAMVLALGAALPAGASQHDGVIDATVTVADAPEACILVEVNTLDFGTLDFGQNNAISRPSYVIEKCTEASQDLYVTGTHAILLSTNELWQLTQTMNPGHNEYAVDVFGFGGGQMLGETTKLHSPNMPDSTSGDHTLFMPAAGSDGAGQVASFQIIWTAVLSG